MADSGASQPVTAPAGTTKTARRARGSLSPEEILNGAQELVEQHGLQQLSMPALAKRLHSGVTSIYWYFRSKDDLLEALTDRVTRQMYRALPPVGDGPWEDELVTYFMAFRDMLQTTPIYREVFAYRTRLLFLRAAMGPSMLRRLEAGLDLFTRAGLTPEQAAEAFNACSNYTRGFVILEHGLEGEEVDESVARMLQRVDQAEFPTLSQLGDFEKVMWLDEEQYLFGLRLLVHGIRRRHGI